MRFPARSGRLAALATLLAAALVGCGGSDGSTATGAIEAAGATASTPPALRPATVAEGVEEEIEVHDARCRARPGGGGRQFRCHVRTSAKERFILSVEVVEAGGAPVITNCEFATRRQRPLEMSTCAFPGKAGGRP